VFTTSFSHPSLCFSSSAFIASFSTNKPTTMVACLGVPTIDIDTDAILDAVKEKGPEIKKSYDEKYAEFKEEVEVKGKVEIPEKKILLEKDKPSGEDKEIKKAAVKITSEGAFRDEVKELVWNQVEPKLSEQLPADTPEMVRKKALEIAHKKVDEIVDKQLDTMFDDLYKKIDAGEA